MPDSCCWVSIRIPRRRSVRLVGIRMLRLLLGHRNLHALILHVREATRSNQNPLDIW